MASNPRWLLDQRLWLDAFALANLAGLAPDIYIAHSVNDFRHWAERVPLYYSLAAPLVLLPALFARRGPLWQVPGHLVGWSALLVGVVGLLLHLDSRFFHERTIASLVYAAPFAAPLAYTGIGLLLLMNRMVDADAVEWPLWVLLLALGGFVGNFIFSLTDHAQNGFYHATEWVPVVASAFAVGLLVVPFAVRVDRTYVWVGVAVMALQALVGLLGFYYHNAANLRGPSASLWENTVHGAPTLAPLLFPNLALLALIGLWVYRRHLPAASAAAAPPLETPRAAAL